MIDPCKLNPIPALIYGLSFIKARLGEVSTWTSLGVAAAAASQLSAPWSYASMACGIMAAMVPNKRAAS